MGDLLRPGEGPARLTRAPERQIDSITAGKRMHAIRQLVDAMIGEPGRTAPHGDIAMLQTNAPRTLVALEATEQKGRRKSQRHRDDRLAVVRLVAILVQRQLGARFVAV